MKPFLLLYKPQGQTPLRAIDIFRKQSPEYATVTLGVAGRLDPMAEGLILVLIGDENKKRKEYEQMTKTYVMEVLFGFSTDTYDELGLVTHASNPKDINEAQIQEALKNLPDIFDQPYPPYSSKPVSGKPLYYWAREGKLASIAIPSKRVQIFDRSFVGWRTDTTQEINEHIHKRVTAVTGDFRQEPILKEWKARLEASNCDVYPVASVTLTCSSGTYMRGLAHMIGQSLGSDALAYSIRRTSIGPYSVNDALHTI